MIRHYERMAKLTLANGVCTSITNSKRKIHSYLRINNEDSREIPKWISVCGRSYLLQSTSLQVVSDLTWCRYPLCESCQKQRALSDTFGQGYDPHRVYPRRSTLIPRGTPPDLKSGPPTPRLRVS